MAGFFESIYPFGDKTSAPLVYQAYHEDAFKVYKEAYDSGVGDQDTLFRLEQMYLSSKNVRVSDKTIREQILAFNWEDGDGFVKLFNIIHGSHYFPEYDDETDECYFSKGILDVIFFALPLLVRELDANISLAKRDFNAKDNPTAKEQCLKLALDLGHAAFSLAIWLPVEIVRAAAAFALAVAAYIVLKPAVEIYSAVKKCSHGFFKSAVDEEKREEDQGRDNDAERSEESSPVCYTDDGDETYSPKLAGLLLASTSKTGL